MKLTGFRILLFLLFALPCICESAVLQAGNPIAIGKASDGVDCLRVDAERRRLVAVQSQEGRLAVINLKDETLSRQLEIGAAQDVALDKDRYYVSLSREKKLRILSRDTLEVVGEVPLPNHGNRLCAAPKGVDRVFVGYKTGSSLWVVDPTHKNVATTLPVPKGPQFAVAEDDTSRVYQTIASDSTVLVISASDGNSTIGGAWPTSPAKLPQGIELDLREPRRLFVAGFNGKLAVMNAGDGNLITAIDIVPEARQIAFDQQRNRLYCPGKNGITVIDATERTPKVIETVSFEGVVKSVAVDPVTHAVWIGYSAGGVAYAQKFTPVERPAVQR